MPLSAVGVGKTVKGAGFWGVVWMGDWDLGFEQIKLVLAITCPSGEAE